MSKTYRSAMVYGVKTSSLRKEHMEKEIEGVKRIKNKRSYGVSSSYNYDDEDFDYSNYNIKHMR